MRAVATTATVAGTRIGTGTRTGIGKCETAAVAETATGKTATAATATATATEIAEQCARGPIGAAPCARPRGGGVSIRKRIKVQRIQQYKQSYTTHHMNGTWNGSIQQHKHKKCTKS